MFSATLYTERECEDLCGDELSSLDLDLRLIPYLSFKSLVIIVQQQTLSHFLVGWCDKLRSHVILVRPQIKPTKTKSSPKQMRYLLPEPHTDTTAVGLFRKPTEMANALRHVFPIVESFHLLKSLQE
jgi:hypothetical protein